MTTVAPELWLHLTFGCIGPARRPVLLSHGSAQRPVVCAEWSKLGPAHRFPVGPGWLVPTQGEWVVTDAGRALGLCQADLSNVSGPGLLSEGQPALSVRFEEGGL